MHEQQRGGGDKKACHVTPDLSYLRYDYSISGNHRIGVPGGLVGGPRA